MHRHQLIARHRGREVDAELIAQIGDVGARQPDRKLDAPRQIGRPAVVVTHQEAADAPEGVAERQRRRDGVGGEPRRQPAAAHGPEDGQGGEHETAVPDQSIALEQEPPVLVQDRVVDLGAEDAAQRARQQDRAGVLVVADLEPDQVAAQLQVGREERDHHHHSERADGQRPDTEDLSKHLVVRSGSERPSPACGAERRSYRNIASDDRRRGAHPVGDHSRRAGEARRLRRLPPPASLADPHPRQPRPRRPGLGGGAGADPQAPLPRLGHGRLRRHHRSRRERRDGARPPSAAEPRPAPELEELSTLRAGRHPAAHRQQPAARLASSPTS